MITHPLRDPCLTQLRGPIRLFELKPSVDIVCPHGWIEASCIVHTLMGRPSQHHAVPHGFGRQRQHWGRHHGDELRGQIHQRHRVAQILGLEHGLIGLGTNLCTLGRPCEDAFSPTQVDKRRRVSHFSQWATSGRQTHTLAVRIGGQHRHREGLARQHTGVCHGHQNRGLIRTQGNIDLNVPDHLPHLSQLPRHLPPFFDANGHIVFARDFGRIPGDVPGELVDLEDVGHAAHFIRIDIGGDELSIESSGGNKAKSQ